MVNLEEILPAYVGILIPIHPYSNEMQKVLQVSGCDKYLNEVVLLIPTYRY